MKSAIPLRVDRLLIGAFALNTQLGSPDSNMNILKGLRPSSSVQDKLTFTETFTDEHVAAGDIPDPKLTWQA
jgi:hypothetical protein